MRADDVDPGALDAGFSSTEKQILVALKREGRVSLTDLAAELDIVLEIGVDRLRDRTTELVRDYVDRVQDAGFELRTPARDDERAGIVMVRMRDPAEAVRDLGRQGIIVDYRHDRLRASPYFYNTPEDNARLVDGLTPWKA